MTDCPDWWTECTIADLPGEASVQLDVQGIDGSGHRLIWKWDKTSPQSWMDNVARKMGQATTWSTRKMYVLLSPRCAESWYWHCMEDHCGCFFWSLSYGLEWRTYG